MLCCRRYIDYAFDHDHSCIYDSNLLVSPDYMTVLKEGESNFGVVARGVSFLSPLLANA